MSKAMSTSAERKMRKDLIRLRMDMYRQQLLYHSQPVRHPLSGITSLLFSSNRSSKVGEESAGSPMWIGAATVFLALFGKRLGKVGKLARLAITAYPLVLKIKSPR
ncbi:hypothetical protein [Pseudomonas matsuisoli]|uniref:YqjK-like protein n=1 Tax=Pseudomonas matsuisoli TaxID=1515666 RepID=A0A917UW94_9PSED|nr:hypothetical protein [Pseudomonas matsuisoli]GGJ89835.1 hypothetical protein GCM10009304_14260 [Pseudomonas matsuisoli]